jgi:hypothetical protein
LFLRDRIDSKNNSYCEILIAESDADKILIGLPFMKAFYTVFNVENS